MSIFALVLLALFPAANIHGTVRAEGSGAPIARATVQIAELQRTVTADEQGYFVLPGVQAGRWAVRATAIGYRAHEAVVQVSPSGSLRLDFDLAPQPVSLAPVEVREREGG
ncbi:MAG: carboxypeptidase-like regulatory domain-containing protein, partial [Gemmatimonadota bacterium]|nr:carboxypeptidase-like regulatory domain-containing protein [Gemmatimonadota bacterium]